MAMTPEHPRWKPYKLLLLWCEEHDITMPAIAAELGIRSEGAVRKFFQSETMPAAHHARLVELGFPADLLPRGEDRKPGRQPKVPRWPGLDVHAAV